MNINILLQGKLCDPYDRLTDPVTDESTLPKNFNSSVITPAWKSIISK
jgi:hypothetical protein